MLKWLCILCLLLAGCHFSSEEKEATATSTPQASSTNATETVIFSYTTMTSQCETIAQWILENDWSSILKTFSSDIEGINETTLQKDFSQSGINNITAIQQVACKSELDEKTAYALFQTPDGDFEAKMIFNDSLQLLSLSYAKRNDEVNLQADEDYTEESLVLGGDLGIHGILCLPTDVENPPVAILMPENLEDGMDSSGEDTSFRKDLAHELAKQGIASARFSMRQYEDPLLFETSTEETLKESLTQDFASIVHSLETLSVNANDIIYIGHGTLGSLGYYLVNSHFEIDGGLVLLNAPYAESGDELLCRYLLLSEEDTKTVHDTITALSQEEAEETEELYGYSLDYWKEWIDAGALKWTPKVSIPILILAGENDEMVTVDDNYDLWKSQKGSNVKMREIEETGHTLRNEEGSLEDVAQWICDWHEGKDVEKKS